MKKMQEELNYFVISGSSVSNISSLNNSLLLTSESAIMESKDFGKSWLIIRKLGTDTNSLRLYIDSQNWIWLSLSTQFTDASGEKLPSGAGILYRQSGSDIWRYFNQPKDPRTNFDTKKIANPTTTNVKNLSYAITETYDPNNIQGRKIWIASFAGSLRYIYADSLKTYGKASWHLKTPNNKKLDVANSNVLISYGQRTFSLASNQNKLWVGTALGVYYSDDFGETFQHNPATSAANTLTGNFITFLANKGDSLYVNSRIAFQGETNGLSFADFTGIGADSNSAKASFTTILENEWIYDAFVKDNMSLFSGERGLFYNFDNTNTYQHISDIENKDGSLRLNSNEYFAVYSYNDMNQKPTILLGALDGFAISNDMAKTWDVYKSSLVSENLRKRDTVLPSPSPFSPKHSIAKVSFYYPQRETGLSRLYIYNYAMELVFKKQKHQVGNELTKNMIWDGRDSSGYFVANGVYFIKVETPGNILWNKLVIVN